jgi:hypothetical protein
VKQEQRQVGVGAGAGTLCRSRASYPASVASTSRASATDLVSGPTATRVFHPADDGSCGIRPKVGLNPAIPQKAAGIRIDPPPSPPSDTGPQPLATAAAAPPDEPPEVRLVSHGLLVRPKSADSVTPK